MTDSAGRPRSLRRTTIRSRTRDIPQPFHGSVVSISLCSQRGREPFGVNVLPKLLPKRSYSVVLCRQGLPTDQGSDYVLRGIPVSVRKTVICITQVTHGGWKAPSTIANTRVSLATCHGLSACDPVCDPKACLLCVSDLSRVTVLVADFCGSWWKSLEVERTQSRSGF